MNSVWGLTGIGLVPFVVLTTAATWHVDERRPAARDAAAYGVGVGNLDRRLYSRAGPKRQLAELKKKAEPVVKGD